MRNRSTIKRSAAAVTTLALLALAASAVAAAATAPPSTAQQPLDVAPAPGAVMAVPPPAPPPVLAPSEAAERFARSLVLESVGDEGGAPDAADPSAAAGAPAAGGDGELLRWAISHSDPAALREAAKKAQDLSVEERRQRVAELRAVMEGGGLKSDTDLMKGAVAELSAFLEGGNDDVATARSALERLADLAQSIDNANDLRPLGALAPLAALIGGGKGGKGAATVDPSLRAAAARCVGVAASNNARFQGDLLAAEPRAVAHLLEAVGRKNDDEKLRLPALFAASTFARSAAPASREAFFAAGGVARLVELLGEEASRRHPQLALNAVVLLGDLADLGAAGDDGGALVAAVGQGEGEGGNSGDSTWRALAEGVLRTVGGADSAPTSVDKALSAVRALSGLELGRLALVAAGGEQRLAAAAGEVAAGGSGGGGAEYRQYLSELATELSEQLKGGSGGEGRSEL